jgi:hypothetical protein
MEDGHARHRLLADRRGDPGFLVLSAFFSGSETALTASSRGKLRSQADKGARGADRAEADRGQRAADRRGPAGQQPGQHPGRLAGHGAVHAALRRQRRGAGDAGDDAAGAVFAEVLPKTYAITNPETAARGWPARSGLIVVLVFSPVVAPCGAGAG